MVASKHLELIQVRQHLIYTYVLDLKESSKGDVVDDDSAYYDEDYGGCLVEACMSIGVATAETENMQE